MINVRLYSFPAPAGAHGKREIQVEATAGLTVGDIANTAGIGPGEMYILMINGYGAKPDCEVSDGDLVVIFPAVFGG
jgi:molybdopterin converting factor small subunit